jgi:hypothetical protein
MKMAIFHPMVAYAVKNSDTEVADKDISIN